MKVIIYTSRFGRLPQRTINMRFVKKVNERGVVTLPAEVREALGVDEGDIVEFDVLGVVKKKGQNSPARFAAEVAAEERNTSEGQA